MLIEVKGNSGCTINIVGTDNKLLVHKSTYDKSYIPRLVNQANKQKNAALIANIEVPEVQNNRSEEGGEHKVNISRSFSYSRWF